MASHKLLLGLAVMLSGCVSPALAFAQSALVYNGCDTVPTFQRREIHATPNDLGAKLQAAAPGDVILLATGEYGKLVLSRRNAGFVTVTAAPGQSPVLSGVSVAGSHWIISKLAIIGYAPPKVTPNGWQQHEPLVNVGRGDNFVILGNTIASVRGAYPWSEEIHGVPDAYPLSDGVWTNNSSCVSVSDNHIFNVFDGIMVGGDQQALDGKRYIISNNTIENFAGDGIDHSVSDAIIRGNHISDNHDICHEICVHTDGIQGWNYQLRPGLLNSNILIDSNVIIQPKTPHLLLSSSTLQGITIFNGNWNNLSVINNIVIVNAWHGISLYGIKRGVIANNTVVGTSDKSTWIMTTDESAVQGGATVEHVVIRNNIAPLIRVIVKENLRSRDIDVDHNLDGANPSRVFKKFDTAHQQYDLHLRPGSPAIGKGAPAPGATDDINGLSRGVRPDLGAYVYATH